MVADRRQMYKGLTPQYRSQAPRPQLGNGSSAKWRSSARWRWARTGPKTSRATSAPSSAIPTESSATSTTMGITALVSAGVGTTTSDTTFANLTAASSAWRAGLETTVRTVSNFPLPSSRASSRREASGEEEERPLVLARAYSAAAGACGGRRARALREGEDGGGGGGGESAGHLLSVAREARAGGTFALTVMEVGRMAVEILSHSRS